MRAQALAVAQYDGGPVHARDGGERGFDLPQFDAVAAQLHLVVCASDKLDSSAGLTLDDVSSAVQARAGPGGKRIGQKAPGGERGLAQVATRQTVAAQIQFSRNPGRQRLQIPIEDVRRRVGDGQTDGRAAVALDLANGMPGGERGGFGRPVNVDENSRSPVFEHARDVTRRLRFPAHQQSVQGCEGRGFFRHHAVE